MLWIWTGLSPLVEHWCERFSPRPLQQVRCTVVVWGLTHSHFTQACQLPGYLVATATAWRPHRSPSSHHFGRHGHLFSVGAGVLSGATFSQFQEDEEDGWERPNSDSGWGVLSRPIRRHTADRSSTSSTHRPASPPPPALSSVSPRSFKPVLLKVCLPWQCCLGQHQVLMSCVCVCSGGDEGGGDREMSQRHQEAPRGDGVQKQQVTATNTESAWCHRPDSLWYCRCFYANSS